MLTFDALNAKVITEPYPHIAVGNALSRYSEIDSDFPEESEFGPSLRMHGDLTYVDAQYQELIARSPVYQALHRWVYSAEFIQQFLTMFDLEIDAKVSSGELLFDPRSLPIRPEPFEARTKINVDRVGSKDPFLFPRLDLGVGRLNYGREHGGGGVHVDNLTRLISTLVYIGENPSMKGGEHRLYKLEGTRPLIDKVYAPKPNFMVASVQSNFAYHDVNPVTHIEGVRKAFYLAVSCSTEIWRPHRDRSLSKLTKNRYRPPAHVKAVQRTFKWAKGIRRRVIDLGRN